MKLLLTSGGVTNPSIHSALVQLLGKPIAECHVLVVPTVARLVRVVTCYKGRQMERVAYKG